MRVRATFFRAGRLVRLGRVRRALGLRVSHCALEVGDWSLLWGAEYGSGALGGRVDGLRRDLGDGEACVVWSEAYECRDLLDFEAEVDGPSAERALAEAHGLRRELEAACAASARGDWSRLAGARSAWAAARVLAAAGWLELGGLERGGLDLGRRDARSLTCCDLLALCRAFRARGDFI